MAERDQTEHQNDEGADSTWPLRMIQDAIDRGDGRSIERIVHELRVAPFGDYENATGNNGHMRQDAVEVNRMVDEGCPNSQ